jgi:hypothetical protein
LSCFYAKEKKVCVLDIMDVQNKSHVTVLAVINAHSEKIVPIVKIAHIVKWQEETVHLVDIFGK